MSACLMHFFAYVSATLKAAGVNYRIWDFIGVNCDHDIQIWYSEGGTTATAVSVNGVGTISQASVGNGIAAYGGSMTVGKSICSFTLFIEAANRTIKFKLIDAHGKVVADRTDVYDANSTVILVAYD